MSEPWKTAIDAQGRMPLPAALGAGGLYSVIVAPRSGGGVWVVTREGERELPLPVRVISRRVAVDKDGAIRVPAEMNAWKGKGVSIRSEKPGLWVAVKV
jgi:hypothetical protein